MFLLMLIVIASGIPGETLFNVTGTIDVFTFENTIFYWKSKMYILENIPCKYWEHASRWDAQYTNASYARVRELETGVVVSNITSTIGFGFISAFTDYEKDTLWLFGTHANRCIHQKDPLTFVQSWWSKDLTTWSTAKALDYPAGTHNVQVTRVGSLPGGNVPAHTPPASLPPHRYAMFLECFAWAINNNEDGNLTSGWQIIPSKKPDAPCGGPSFRYNPLDQKYYILTGGRSVHLLRTSDFIEWEESTQKPFIAPSRPDAFVSQFCNFSHEAEIKGSPPWEERSKYKDVPFVPYWRDNYQAWDHNTNDADICCMHNDVKQSYLVWGASTQGGPPKKPLDGGDAGVNVVAVGSDPLPQLLANAFK